MLVEHYYPQSLSHTRLDKYLASGWFRSAPMLYRSQLICLEGDVYSTVNIRIRLDNYQFKKRFRKIIHRNEKRFTVRIQSARLDEARDRLYQGQKHRFRGFIFDHLHQFFYANLDGSVFDTLEVGIYDEDRLVAVSFFDQGRRSLASILGLYDQDYEKYSLGTYTLLTEMAYGLDTGRKFYYPGYVLDRPSVFDYKLQLANGQMQYYDWKGKWKPYEKLNLERFTVHILREKMLALHQAIGLEDTTFRKILYPMFSVGYLAFMGDQFVKSPMFLAHSPQTRRPFYLVIEYLIEEETYRLSWVSPCPEYQEFLNMHISEDLLDEKLYHMDLLRTDEVIYEHTSATKIIEEALRLI